MYIYIYIYICILFRKITWNVESIVSKTQSSRWYLILSTFFSFHIFKLKSLYLIGLESGKIVSTHMFPVQVVNERPQESFWMFQEMWWEDLLLCEDFYIPRKARFIPTFCKRINCTQTALEIWARGFEERKTNYLSVQQYTTTTTTINRGFTPNGINNECVSNSSKKSSQGVR